MEDNSSVVFPFNLSHLIHSNAVAWLELRLNNCRWPLLDLHSWSIFFHFVFSFFFFSLFAEQAAGVYHRESRKGRYQLTYKEAKELCKFEGGKLASYKQLEAARQIGLWFTHKVAEPKVFPRIWFIMHFQVSAFQNLGSNSLSFTFLSLCSLQSVYVKHLSSDFGWKQQEAHLHAATFWIRSVFNVKRRCIFFVALLVPMKIVWQNVKLLITCGGSFFHFAF